VPRQTVDRWRREHCRHLERRLLADKSWRPINAEAYCYLLGLYLGDGHLVLGRRSSAFLRLTLDERYPGVIEEDAQATEDVIPDSPVRRYKFGTARRLILQASHPVLPFAFPQHGRGKEHSRLIALEPWQETLTTDHPRSFLRGLIHSDGCRTTNTVRVRSRNGHVTTYEYTRYFFSNESSDIIELFTAHCELVGARCTRSSRRNLSVSSRTSVAILDSFVGPKS
jgi:hypothetical protein